MRARLADLARRTAGSWLVLIALPLLAGAPALAQLPAPTYRVFRPGAPGSHPAVAFVSGCDGFAPPMAPAVYERRAERLRGLGHVVVFVDYLGRRGLKSCGGAVTHEDAARDLGEAVAWLRAQPFVDASRITAMGWSYGGRAVLVALVRHAGADASFARAIVLYPDCRALAPWRGSVPVLMLLGGADEMTPATLCQDVVTRLPVPGAVKLVVYPGALHGFDIPDLPAKMRYGFATIGHHPAATAAAWTEIERFLRAPR